MDKYKKISRKTSGKTEVKLDVTITEFFQILSKMARIRIGLRFILLALCFLGTSWLILGISDRFWATTVSARSLIFFIGIISALWAVINVISYTFYYTRKLPWLCKCVRKEYRAEGERLLGITEISEQEKKGDQTFFQLKSLRLPSKKWLKKLNPCKWERFFLGKKVRLPALSACVIFLIILLAYATYPGANQKYIQKG